MISFSSMDLQALLTPSLENLQIDPHEETISLQNPNPKPHLQFQPLQSTFFKRQSKQQKRERRIQRKKSKRARKQTLLTQQDPQKLNSLSSRPAQWPVEPAQSPAPRAGWAHREPPQARPARTEESPSALAAQLQQRAVKACQVYFREKEMENECDEEEEEEEEEDETLEFMRGLFDERERELRGYYEETKRKRVGGELVCLVCGGVGEKIGKKYGDCFAIIQHSLTVWKTNTRGAHRAFGRVLCEVLGFDVNGFLGGRNSDSTKAQLNGAKEDIHINQGTIGSVGNDIEELMDCCASL